MKKKLKILSMIPARIGSERLKYKNLALINNKPLISFAINAAKKSKIFDKIYINSDHNIFSKIAERYKVNFYKRPSRLGGSKIRSDIVVYDFIKKNNCDILVWINPIAPLQSQNEINEVVNYFIKKKYDSLVTTNKKQVHAKYLNKPLNYKKNSPFLKTQNLNYIELLVYSLMMWNTKSFLKSFEKFGHGILCGKSGNYIVSDISGIIVKTENDLKLIKAILDIKKNKSKLKYDKIINNL